MASGTNKLTVKGRTANQREIMSVYTKTTHLTKEGHDTGLKITGQKPPDARPKVKGKSNIGEGYSRKTSTGSNISTDTGIASGSSSNSLVSLKSSTGSDKTNTTVDSGKACRGTSVPSLPDTSTVSPPGVFKAESRPFSCSTVASEYTTHTGITTGMSDVTLRDINYSDCDFRFRDTPSDVTSGLTSRNTDTAFSIRTDISIASTIDNEALIEAVAQAQPGYISHFRPKAARGTRNK